MVIDRTGQGIKLDVQLLVILDIPLRSPACVLCFRAGRVETGEGRRIGLRGTGAERESLKHPLHSLPFFEAAELRHVEAGRSQLLTALNLTSAQWAKALGAFASVL